MGVVVKPNLMGCTGYMFEELNAIQWSPAARAMWAKAAPETHESLSLPQHLMDTAAVAGMIFDDLPESILQLASDNFSGDLDQARCFVVFCPGIHDIGKCSEDFQFKAGLVGQPDLCDAVRAQGFPLSTSITNPYRHGEIGQAHLRDWLKRTYGADKRRADVIAALVGGHHGAYPQESDVNLAAERLAYESRRESGKGAIWGQTRDELCEQIAKAVGADRYLQQWLDNPPSQSFQVLVQAIIIQADWIASDEHCFPYNAVLPMEQRLEQAVEALKLPHPWTPSTPVDEIVEEFSCRFPSIPGGQPNAMQSAMMKAALDVQEPCLMILEAAMGSGKTEAAQMATEILARRFGCGGTFIGLPTMATGNAMFSRWLDWLNRVPTSNKSAIVLAHSKAELNDDFSQLANESRVQGIGDDLTAPDQGATQVYEYFKGRKKSILASHVIGTIDQALMMALSAKHVVFRHLGLAGKVVIIDEVHAADTYMRVYLKRALTWLGAYHTPVILMSATLPPSQRHELMEAYRDGIYAGDRQYRKSKPVIPQAAVENYPLISVVGRDIQYIDVPNQTQGNQVKIVEAADDDQTLLELVDRTTIDGCCVGIIRNTVDRAQRTYKLLSSEFPDDVVLIHSRFLAPDRAEKEQHLVKQLGRDGSRRPHRLIVVGTQVLEQSLDVDFDLLITDLAPIDLVLQRIGRMHRHTRQRPAQFRNAECVIVGVQNWHADPPEFPSGAKAIYGEAALIRAAAVLRGLPERTVTLPVDIPLLVQEAYSSDIAVPQKWFDRLLTADQKQHYLDSERINKAQGFLIRDPLSSRNMTSWGNTGLSSDSEIGDSHGKAVVRDTEDSIEVVAVVAGEDGLARIPERQDWATGRVIPWLITPHEEHIAKAASRYTVSLPRALSGEWIINQTIDQLETPEFDLNGWQQSHWLKGELILFFDEFGNSELVNRNIHYDKNIGLVITTKEERGE